MADKKKSANAARDGMRRRSMAQDGGDARRASTIRRSSLIRLMAVEQDLDKVEATLPSINNTASGLAQSQALSRIEGDQQKGKAERGLQGASRLR